MTEIVAIVKELGLPSAFLIAMFWIYRKDTQQYIAAHDAMFKEVLEALKNNTKAITTLTDIVGKCPNSGE